VAQASVPPCAPVSSASFSPCMAGLQGLAACLVLLRLCAAERGERGGRKGGFVLELEPGGYFHAPMRRGQPRPGPAPESGGGLELDAEGGLVPAAALELAGNASSGTSTAQTWPWEWFFGSASTDSKKKASRGSKSRLSVASLKRALISEEEIGQDAPPGQLAKGDVRVMNFNVYFANTNYSDIAELIGKQFDPDFVSLQEAVGESSQKIVDALNQLGDGEWRLANPWNESWWWCGQLAYRSDKWTAMWTRQVPVPQGFHHRGVCGALLSRKADNVRLCAFGAHPVFESFGPPEMAADAIQKASSMVKECHEEHDAPVVFMCDCSTANHSAVTQALTANTGFKFSLAYAEVFDQIHVESSPKQIGKVHSRHAVGQLAGDRYCKSDCQRKAWAYSDHPAMSVDITPQ